jgi:hypothetical protein
VCRQQRFASWSKMRKTLVRNRTVTCFGVIVVM